MKLNKTVIDEIYQHALKEYPDECCGIITGKGDRQTVHRCNNIQNRLHKEDPTRYPRNAHTAYTIDRSEFDFTISSAKKQGEIIIAFYHSHCDHESYFSEEDVAAQTVFGEPEFPDTLHAVISVINRNINDLKYFKWESNNQGFVMVNKSDT